MSAKINTLGALETAELIRKREISVKEAVSAVIAAAEEKDKVYNCYTTLCPEKAL